jgi:hypothetical protein
MAKWRSAAAIHGIRPKWAAANGSDNNKIFRALAAQNVASTHSIFRASVMILAFFGALRDPW